MTLLDDCNKTTLTPELLRVADALTLTSCALSVIGTVTIIVTYVIWLDVRSVVRRLLVFLSIADFLVATSNALGTLHRGNSSDVVCKAQSAITTYSNLSSFFWTVIIATYIFISLVLQKSSVARKLVPLYHVIAWIIPAAIVIAAIWMNVLGRAESEYTLSWCWIRDNTWHMEMWMFLTGKGWEVSAYFVTLVLYITIKCYLWADVSVFAHAHSLFLSSAIYTLPSVNY